MERDVYVTKYALTKGVFCVSAANGGIESEWSHGVYLYYMDVHPSSQSHHQVRLGYSCFLTKEEAIASAEEMRQKKLKSLKRQMKRIEALDLSAVSAS